MLPHQDTERLVDLAKSNGLAVTSIDTEYCFNVEVAQTDAGWA